MFKCGRLTSKLKGAFNFYDTNFKKALNHIYQMAFINAQLTLQVTDLTHFSVFIQFLF